jgi:uncharacterized protein (UPF0276 family)
MRAIPAIGAGVGLRLPHLAEIAAARPRASWFEVHPETFLANPHATELLTEIAAHYPVSVHTVGVSVGSADGIDRGHLTRVRALVERTGAALVSGHLAWSTHAGDYLNDLLPLPYDRRTLRLVADHVDAVQNALGRPYLMENPSSYLGFAGSTMTEVEFLSELVSRTGCRLLCDVSNIHLSAHNLGFDPFRYVDGLPADAVAEFHLGGFSVETDGDGPDTVIVDTHGDRIAAEVWPLYAHAVRRFGPKPTLIEWDNDIPPLATLLAEARRADEVAAAALAANAYAMDYDHARTG